MPFSDKLNMIADIRTRTNTLPCVLVFSFRLVSSAHYVGLLVSRRLCVLLCAGVLRFSGPSLVLAVLPSRPVAICRHRVGT